MSDDKFELSRRNALIGLGTVGVASAGAGVGTSAFFSDAEEITGNSIQAGEFGLTVTPSIETVDQDGLGPDEDDFDTNKNGDGVWFTSPFQIGDAKPGDEYKFCYEVKVSDNPGLAKVAVSNLTDETGDQNSESNVTAGDLYNVSSGGLSTLGQKANATLTLEDSSGTTHTLADDSLSVVLNTLTGNGYVIPSKVNTDGEGTVCHAADTPVTVCLTVTIPDTVGNEIQGAMTSFDLTVYAEQCRHNTESEFANVSV